jgi:hypothetical protein
MFVVAVSQGSSMLSIFASFDPMERIKNTATPAQVSKVLKGYFGSRFNEIVFTPLCSLSATEDDVADAYKELITDLLHLTPRPTANLIKEGCLLAFAMEGKLAATFSGKLYDCIIYCRSKEKCSTSGAKLNRSVFEITQVLGKVKDGSIGEQLKRRALKIMRSDPASPSRAATGSWTGPPPESPSSSMARSSSKTGPPPQSPSPSAAASSSSGALYGFCCSSPDADAKIYALYGLSPPPVPAAKKASCIEVLDSPLSVLASQLSSQNESPQKDSAAYFDSYEMAQCRVTADGQTVQARMEAGSSGFLKACWPDGSVSQTEVPNLTILPLAAKEQPETGPKKRPAAAAAKPAAARKKAAASKEDDDFVIDKSSIKIIKGLKAKQSYLTCFKPPKLIVAVSSRQAPQHAEIIDRLLAYITEDPGNTTKQDARKRRSELLDVRL